nr:MAG: hypothetical protein [Bee densovirus 2]
MRFDVAILSTAFGFLAINFIERCNRSCSTSSFVALSFTLRVAPAIFASYHLSPRVMLFFPSYQLIVRRCFPIFSSNPYFTSSPFFKKEIFEDIIPVGSCELPYGLVFCASWSKFSKRFNLLPPDVPAVSSSIGTIVDDVDVVIFD